jgi:hypothetical protein
VSSSTPEVLRNTVSVAAGATSPSSLGSRGQMSAEAPVPHSCGARGTVGRLVALWGLHGWYAPRPGLQCERYGVMTCNRMGKMACCSASGTRPPAVSTLYEPLRNRRDVHPQHIPVCGFHMTGIALYTICYRRA